jgi:SAM-dependent methyltransferase
MTNRIQTRLKAAYRRVRYYGFKYRCPFCRATLRTFLPFGLNHPLLVQKNVVGGGLRPQALCPVCGSLDRERLVYLYLKNNTDVFKKSLRLLHVAPETRLRAILQKQSNIAYLAADLIPRPGQVAMDITAIPFPDETFEAIICCHVLEHVVEDARALSELYRVLKPGGMAVLQVPMSLTLTSTYEDLTITTEEAREKAFGLTSHVRIYARDYPKRLARAGFQVDVFSWPDHSRKFGGKCNVFGLNKKEDVVCAFSP